MTQESERRHQLVKTDGGDYIYTSGDLTTFGRPGVQYAYPFDFEDDGKTLIRLINKAAQQQGRQYNEVRQEYDSGKTITWTRGADQDPE